MCSSDLGVAHRRGEQAQSPSCRLRAGLNDGCLEHGCLLTLGWSAPRPGTKPPAVNKKKRAAEAAALPRFRDCRLRVSGAERERAAAAVRVDAPAVGAGRAAVRDVLVRGGGLAGRDLRPRGAVPLLQVEVEIGRASCRERV